MYKDKHTFGTESLTSPPKVVTSFTNHPLWNSHLIQDAKRLWSLDDRLKCEPGASKGRLALLETILLCSCCRNVELLASALTLDETRWFFWNATWLSSQAIRTTLDIQVGAVVKELADVGLREEGEPVALRVGLAFLKTSKLVGGEARWEVIAVCAFASLKATVFYSKAVTYDVPENKIKMLWNEFTLKS